MLTSDEIGFLKSHAASGGSKDDGIRLLEERRKVLSQTPEQKFGKQFVSGLSDVAKGAVDTVKGVGNALDFVATAGAQGVESVISGVTGQPEYRVPKVSESIKGAFQKVSGKDMTANVGSVEKNAPVGFPERALKVAKGAGGIAASLSAAPYALAGAAEPILKKSMEGYLSEKPVRDFAQSVAKKVEDFKKSMPEERWNTIADSTSMLANVLGTAGAKKATDIGIKSWKELEAAAFGEMKARPAELPKINGISAPSEAVGTAIKPIAQEFATGVRKSQYEIKYNNSVDLIRSPETVSSLKKLKPGEIKSGILGTTEVIAKRKSDIAKELTDRIPKLEEAINTTTGTPDPIKAFNTVDSYVRGKTLETVNNLNSQPVKMGDAEFQTIKNDVKKEILADPTYKEVYLKIGQKKFDKQLDIAFVRFQDQAKYKNGMGDFYDEMIGMSQNFNLGEEQTVIDGIIAKQIRKQGGNFIEKKLSEVGAEMSFQNDMKSMHKILEGRDLIEGNMYNPYNTTIKKFTNIVTKLDVGLMGMATLKPLAATLGVATLGGKVARQLYRKTSGIMADMIENLTKSGKYAPSEINQLKAEKEALDAMLLRDEVSKATTPYKNPQIAVAPETPLLTGGSDLPSGQNPNMPIPLGPKTKLQPENNIVKPSENVVGGVTNPIDNANGKSDSAAPKLEQDNAVNNVNQVNGVNQQQTITEPTQSQVVSPTENPMVDAVVNPSKIEALDKSVKIKAGSPEALAKAEAKGGLNPFESTFMKQMENGEAFLVRKGDPEFDMVKNLKKGYKVEKHGEGFLITKNSK